LYIVFLILTNFSYSGGIKMKNKNILSAILTLSMLIPALPILARDQIPGAKPEQKTEIKPESTVKHEDQKEAKPENKTDAKPENKTKENKEGSKNPFTKLGKFWTKANTQKKVLTGLGIGLGVLLAGFTLKKTYKFIPKICTYLMPVLGLATSFLTLNHVASKPANKDFQDLMGKFQMKAVTTFLKVKNLFGNFFGQKK
jgi:hypothetical protein